MLTRKKIIFLFSALVFTALFWFLKSNKLELEQKQWLIYHNTKHGYSIEYPAPLVPQPGKDFDNVFFCSLGDPCVIGIRVGSTELRTIEEWLSQNSKQRVEQKLSRNGYEGVITHYISSEGDISEEKIMAFIKDGKLYTIGTSYVRDSERVMNSFRFE